MKEKYRYLYKYLVGVLVASLLLVVGASHYQAEALIKIGILQYVEHESLSANREGFLAGLVEAGYVDGDNIEINYLNANADNANLQSMAEKLAKQNDYLFAIATPAAQSLANAAGDQVPLYFSAVTDPVAAKLVESLDSPGHQVTGTIDAGPLSEQVELLIQVQPDIKKVGILYNSGESNSVSEVAKAEEIFEAKGIEVIKQSITSTNDIQQAMTALVQQVSGVFLVTDNSVAASMDLVGDLAIEAKIPLIGGSADMVQTNGLATYGFDYYELGKQTAQMLVSQLETGTPAKDMPVQTAKHLNLVVNQKVAQALGLDPNAIKVPE